ncbi:MAG TPA: copper chaperone PCu(A)C [Chromatiaceae bacterium]|nr:copper chaperone PCu(A)C [Chromatiaceae bacterium]HIA08428.1 copper chaperone PCu(A)C [Chromatiaceae bacterium]HIN82513.1 copper chaperone PCu(A)C [Chromatiales bacterium]HIO15002.1 copper chaperone PCu(A)C [Chromatiales bacterium]HIO53786.1 copper chaperone PCu(A)C [Chromatiales bacterium]
MKRLRVFGTALWLAASNVAAEPANVVVENAWVRAAPPNAKVMAGYLTLRNQADIPLRLMRVSSPDFKRIEIHQSLNQDGMARMIALPHLHLAAQGTLRLEPGGSHLMLIEPTRKLFINRSVTLSIVFGNGSSTNTSMVIK